MRKTISVSGYRSDFPPRMNCSAPGGVRNWPFWDALIKEMIPYLEAHFRMIPKPFERVLTGGSTGGWESLGVQVFYPDFFGGTWTLYPDPIDFRRYGLSNVY